ncbi:hypothetical protein C5167_028954 [Papaver somniferum]|nr:hypothetical protein C5167_028954 [Papaver somniferum]
MDILEGSRNESLGVAMDFPELHTKRMKILHRDPKLHAQRVASIKVWDARTFLMLAKAKGTAEARKRASDSVKAFFHDPENRRKRSLAMKVTAKGKAIEDITVQNFLRMDH